MKKSFLLSLSLLFLFTHLTFSQSTDPRAARFDYAPGKIIVKLKDEVQANVTYSRGVGSTQMDIAQLLELDAEVVNTKVLFSEKAVQQSLLRNRSNSGDARVPNPSSLKNTFLLEFKSTQESIQELVEELNENDLVEYAEPDYHYSVNDFTVDSDIIYPADLTDNEESSNEPNDPLYIEQTNITQTNIHEVWENYTTGNGEQIIAILDTGIDYNHPDLAANIWINEAELNGVGGFDDDSNGFVDDVRGWDFINNNNDPMDDNMHGTHVAGIAGAVGNNDIGVAGAAWNVKLMPVKVFQSNGVGNASTIAEGITYAANNGATIINMSFGSYAESITMRHALENAYATSVLVAAAGNDGIAIGPCIGCAPSYPAAYSFVIGVEDAAGYSNFDQDGPIYSGYANLLNYEVKAPGTSIMSTVPNGGYRKLTGTSMASPLVAGGIALYNEQKPNDSKELLIGSLINTSGTYVDFLEAIEVIPTPELQVLSVMTKDTINEQNGNDYIEPGEIIEFFPLVKNYWGPTEDVRVRIEFAEFEDQTKATILEEEIAIGSISAYATLQDLTQSLKVKIADTISNNVNINFNLKVWSGPNHEYLTSTEYAINVKNTILLYGIVSEDLILYPDKQYLVSDNLIISEDAELIIKPGTTVKIADNKTISIFDNARLIAQGTKDSIINFENNNNYWRGFDFQSANMNSSILSYNKITGVNPSLHANLFGGYNNSPSYLNITNILVNNSYFDINEQVLKLGISNISNSNFYDNTFYLFSWSGEVGENLNIIRNESIFNSGARTGIQLNAMDTTYERVNIFNNGYSISCNDGGTSVPITAYLGTSVESKYRDEVLDALTSDFTGLLNLNSISPIPYAENHGIVWKVLINRKDAQDEYDLMDPIGVGTHTFEVYFNREMDRNYPPQISYGIREPYTQKIISEEGTWSDDGKIYTVEHEVKIGAADGINRIRVQGARDLDYFYIPIEDSRFNMLVQSAGSASTGFMASPGLGEITLEWEEPSEELLTDVLGYNMYRYEALSDSTFTEPEKINQTLISDVEFIDFDVEEDVNYYYKYKILRTSLEETDYSKTVSSKPLTSLLGDSNGDFGVDVMDLVHNVDYILGNNPTPFIFKAADVNNDGVINVLDIVGTVDIILNPTSNRVASTGSANISYYSTTAVDEALFYWEENDLFVESDSPITGIQLAFDKDLNYTTSQELTNFEWLNYEQDNQKVTMLYSFTNQQIPAGKTKLLTKSSDSEASFDVDKAVVGTLQGLPLNAVYDNNPLLGIDAPEQGDTAQVFILAPNPTSGVLNISYYLPEQMDKVRMYAYDMQGKVVWSQDAFKNTSGQTNTSVNLTSLNDGVYVFVIDVLRANQLQAREVNRIIVNK